MLKIATLNVCGIADKQKRNFLFQKILKSDIDIMALQEVHCTSSRVKLWEQEWPGKCLWNFGGPNDAGVAILFNPKLKTELSDKDGDFNGRALAITIESLGLKFRLINIYAYNTENRFECENFFEELSSMH